MKKIHYAGIPCKAKERGISYTHVKGLVTCSACLESLNGKTKVVKVKEQKADDKRGNKQDSK